MTNTPYAARIRNALETGEFLYTLEHVPAIRGDNNAADVKVLTHEAEKVGQNPRICGVNIGDRVKSLDSLDTVDCGRIVADASGKMPLLHLAGKNREPAEAVGVYERALEQGLRAFLIISGDGVPRTTEGPRTRYHDSVNGIVDIKVLDPKVFVAATVSPFKYREEELLNQYLKMAKKYNAGADYFITNCGWDMRKLQELIWYRDARGFKVPVVANLLLPTRGWARGIHKKRLPGVHMTDDLMAKIEEEYADKKSARALGLRRLALQIVGVKHMGYAGVQLSGIETHDALCEAIETADLLERELPSLDLWQSAWNEAHRCEDGRSAAFAPPGAFYLYDDGPPEKNSQAGPPEVVGVTATAAERVKAKWLDRIDRMVFQEKSLGAAIIGPVCRALDGAALRRFEHAIKQPILGCEMCGFCRIPHLSYVCPETCPKGLANGPCSGTDDNVCEFKDRECIHNSKYRIAKALGRLSDLETVLVPAVKDSRNTSSWANKFRGDDPEATSLAVRKSAPVRETRVKTKV